MCRWKQIGIVIIMTALNSQASHLAGVEVKSIDLHAYKHDLHVTITKNDESELSAIVVRFGSTTYSVPKEELEGSGSNCHLPNVRLLVPSASPGRTITSNDLESIVISIPYGKATANYIGEYELHSFNEVRFIFRKNKFEQRIRSVTMGDGKSLWQIYSKEAEQKEIKEGVLQGIKNPLGPEIVEND